jgi:hypothetical protein
MRFVLIVSLVVCLTMVAGMASAAAPGQVSDTTLAAFGLGGMQQMTDAQGTDIRGMGCIIVKANAFAVSGRSVGASSISVFSTDKKVLVANGAAAGKGNISGYGPSITACGAVAGSLVIVSSR